MPDLQPLRWNLIKRRRFAWSGWRLLVELDGGNNPIRRYAWGLDVAEVAAGLSTGRSDAGYGAPALQAAGGVGGLLAMQDAQGTPWDPNDDLKYVYLYDANGNVGQLADWSHDPNDPAGAAAVRALSGDGGGWEDTRKRAYRLGATEIARLRSRLGRNAAR